MKNRKVYSKSVHELKSIYCCLHRCICRKTTTYCCAKPKNLKKLQNY